MCVSFVVARFIVAAFLVSFTWIYVHVYDINISNIYMCIRGHTYAQRVWSFAASNQTGCLY